MLFEILVVAGAGTMAFALRTFHSPILFRLGTFGLVATSFLAGWLIAGSLAAGLAFAATWFVLPWLEILTRARRMRMPADRRLEPCPPPARAAFPSLEELSGEMESIGFEYMEDAGWSHDDTRHFYRLFLNPDRTTVAAICLVEQADFAFYYLTFRSRSSGGGLVVTWNYPFAHGLRQIPDVFINRVAGEQSTAALLRSHEEAVKRLPGGNAVPVAPDQIRRELEADLRSQVDHNIACGILRRDGDAMIRYTPRGMMFLWVQFLRDFVRFS